MIAWTSPDAPRWIVPHSIWAVAALGGVGWLMIAVMVWDAMRPAPVTPDVGVLAPVVVTLAEDPFPCSQDLTLRAAYARLEGRGFEITCAPFETEGR